MRTVVAEIRHRGGVMRVGALRAAGYTTAQIRAAIARGDAQHVRKGWVATAGARADLISAVRVGGRLACLSAARHHGLWVPEELDVVHVGLPRHAGRRFGNLAGILTHWGSPSWADEQRTVESVEALVRQVLLCCDQQSAIAIIDSALHQRKLSAAALRRVIHGLPARFGSVLDLVDPASESGLESLCRVRVRALGVSVRSQVAIAGVGRVDLVVGDRLVIEADGRQWHDGTKAFHADRTRDLALLRLGYIVIRVSYAHVMDEWMLVELTVRALIARREHLWSAAHRREGLGR